MEFFVNFSPETDGRYINFEANANGALHCKIGPGRGNRVPLASLDIPQPELTARVEEESWSIRLFVPQGCITALYGRTEYRRGDRIRAVLTNIPTLVMAGMFLYTTVGAIRVS